MDGCERSRVTGVKPQGPGETVDSVALEDNSLSLKLQNLMFTRCSMQYY